MSAERTAALATDATSSHTVRGDCLGATPAESAPARPHTVCVRKQIQN